MDYCFASRQERRESFYRFVDWYNYQRPPSALKGLTPLQRLKSYYHIQLAEVWTTLEKSTHIFLI